MREKRWFKIVFGLPGRIVIGVFIISIIGYSYVVEYNYSFNGVIVRIEPKSAGHGRYFVVHGQKYYDDWIHASNTNDAMAVGDTVIKKSGTTDFILLKRKDKPGQ